MRGGNAGGYGQPPQVVTVTRAVTTSRRSSYGQRGQVSYNAPQGGSGQDPWSPSASGSQHSTIIRRSDPQLLTGTAQPLSPRGVAGMFTE